MPLTPQMALDIIKKLDFHTYHAKSSNESLLIHSFNVYWLLDQTLRFSQIYSEPERELMRWAALFHDYGKTAADWQTTKRGPHRVSLGDTKYDDLRSILEHYIQEHSKGLLTDADIEDILFIIEFHHGSGHSTSTPARNRMKDVVSECDRAVSQARISEDLLHTLNAVIDTVRYRLFTVELIEHPISPLIIGAFDYVFSETGRIWPLLYSSTSTLFAADADAALPTLQEVNSFVNEQLGTNKGVLRYDGGNARIYTEEGAFLELASTPDEFVAQATALANRYCERKRATTAKGHGTWSNLTEEEYLYGRVCGATYNTILDLCGAPKGEFPRACLKAGGRYGKVTVDSMLLLGLRDKQSAYEQTLRNVLNRLQPLLKKKLQDNEKTPESNCAEARARYDVKELLVPDSSVYPIDRVIDPKSEALEDYERYWTREPLAVCPSCNHFLQGNVTAAAFPQFSPLGGTVEVFYTSYMRRVKKEGSQKRGVSFCHWCAKWWEIIAADTEGRLHLYHFCVLPRHLFARLDWKEILEPDPAGELVELGSLGTIASSGIYPHIAVLHLPGQDRNDLLAQLAGNPSRNDHQILDRLYQYGLKGAVITTNPISSRHLLTCGSIRIETSEWPLLRRALRLLNPRKRRYTSAITALQQSPFAFGTFLADGSIPITKKTEKEIEQMVQELAEKTGLSFLREIWVGDGYDGASKVIRGMNETLRRLKGKEDDVSLLDGMTAKGFHLALSTRKGRFRPKENHAKEEAALRQAAAKLLKYKDQTYRRTELVRAMIYTLAYFSKPEEKPQETAQDSSAA